MTTTKQHPALDKLGRILRHELEPAAAAKLTDSLCSETAGVLEQWQSGWQEFAALRPDLFGCSMRALPGRAEALAFLYAQTRTQLLPVELSAHERDGLAAAREVLQAWTGLADLWRPARMVTWSRGECLALESACDLPSEGYAIGGSLCLQPELSEVAWIRPGFVEGQRNFSSGRVGALFAHPETGAALSRLAQRNNDVAWRLEMFTAQLAQTVVRVQMDANQPPDMQELLAETSFVWQRSVAELLTAFKERTSPKDLFGALVEAWPAVAAAETSEAAGAALDACFKQLVGGGEWLPKLSPLDSLAWLAHGQPRTRQASLHEFDAV